MLSDKRKTIKITLGNRAFFLLSILCDFVTFCKKDVIIFAMKQPANRFEIVKCLEKPLKVLVFDSLDSTNTRAKAMLKDGENDDFLIVAREQTKGRGRFERKFYSPRMRACIFSRRHAENERRDCVLHYYLCDCNGGCGSLRVRQKRACQVGERRVRRTVKNARAYFAKPRLQRTAKSTRSLWVSASICMKKTAVSTKK